MSRLSYTTEVEVSLDRIDVDYLLDEIEARGLEGPDRVNVRAMCDDVRDCFRRRDQQHLDVVLDRIERACRPQRQ